MCWSIAQPLACLTIACSSSPESALCATAELGGLTVLHLDKDFDVVAAVTGQPVERLRA
jgi:hypothetical protein